MTHPAPSREQHTFWSLAQRGDRSAYAIGCVWRWSGPLDLPRLRQAVDTLVRRTPALRTTFSDQVAGTGPRPRLEVHPELAPMFEHVRPAETGDPALLPGYAASAIDLQRGPLLAAVVESDGAVDHFLTLVTHHAVADGPALTELARRLLSTYAGEPGAVPDTSPGGPYATPSATARADWISYLAGSSPARIEAADTGHAAGRPAQAVTVELTGSEADGLLQAASEQACTVYLLLLRSVLAQSAWVDGKIRVGVPIDARQDGEAGRPLAPHTRTFPLAVRRTADGGDHLTDLRDALCFLLEHLEDGEDDVLDALLAVDPGEPPYHLIVNVFRRVDLSSGDGEVTLAGARPLAHRTRAALTVTLVTDDDGRPEQVILVADAEVDRLVLAGLAQRVVDGAARPAARGRTARPEPGVTAATTPSDLQTELWDLVWSAGQDDDGNIIARAGGHRFEPAAIADYVECCLGLIRSVLPGGPATIVDIGCGVGLLARPLAPVADRYYAFDPSIEAVARLSAWAQEHHPTMVVGQAFAHEVPTVLAGVQADIVVLAGVVQFFPSVDYLRSVLVGLHPRIRPAGAILIADLPSSAHPGFPTALQLSDAAVRDIATDAGYSTRMLRRPAHLGELLRRRFDLVLSPRTTPRESAWDGASIEPTSPVRRGEWTVGGGAPPTGDLRETVLGLFGEALGKPITVEQNFFDQGGHSLVATRLVGVLRRRLGIQLGIREFFSDATPAAVLARYELTRGEVGGDER